MSSFDRGFDPARKARVERRQILWPLLEAALAAGCSFITAFVVARIVGPAELGIGAAAVAVHVLLWVAVNALFADPLTQSTSTDAREISSAIWAAALVGLAAACVQAGGGWMLALILDDARLLPMCLLLALPLPLVGAAGAIQGLLTRARRYDLLAARAAVGQGVGTLIGIGAALAGAGAWAIVYQQLATSLLGAGFLLLRAGWRPAFVWRWTAVRALLRIGLPISASTLIQQGRYRLFLLLVGGLLGPAALGQLHLAFRLVDTVRDLVATALWRLLLPALAERQDDPAALRAGVEQALGAYAPILFPICGAMLLAVEPLTVALLGPAWAPSGEAAWPLVLLLVWMLLGFAAGVALIARGETGLALLSNIALLVLTLLGAALVQPQTAQEAVMVWGAAQLIVAPVVAWRTSVLLGVPLGRLYRAGFPALLATAFAVLIGHSVPLALGEPANPWQLIAARLVLGALAYLPYAVVFLRADLRAGWRAVWLARAGALVLLLTVGSGAARGQTVFDQLPQTIPGYDTRLGMPVLARAQARLREMGLDVGPVTVTPSVEAGVGYDSTVLGPARGQGSAFAATRAAMQASAEQSDVRLGAYASADDRRYLDARRQSRTDWSTALGAGVPFAGGMLNLAASHLDLHQDRSDIEARPSDRPIAFRVDDLRAQYSYRFNRLTVVPNVEFTVYRFSNTTVFGIPSNQSFRDRNALSGGLSARYDLEPNFGLLLAARALDTRYTQQRPGIAGRNARGVAALAGIESTGEGLWRYSLLVGAETRRFAGFRTRTTPVADLQLVWLPSGMSSVSLRGTRAIEESAWQSASSATVTRLKLTAEHELFRDIILQAYGGVQLAELANGTGTRMTLNGGTRVIWVVNRQVQLSLAYDMARWSEGLLETAPHDTARLRNLVLASVRLTP